MDRLTELRTALQTKLDENDAIAASFKTEEKSDEDGGGTVGVVVSAEQRDQFRKNLAEAEEIKGLIEDEEKQQGLRRFMDEPAGESVAQAVQAALAGGIETRPQQIKTVGELFLESEEWKALRASGGAEMQTPWTYEGKDMAGVVFLDRKDVYTSLAPQVTGRGFGSIQMDPMVPQQMRTVRVRDLFPAVPTTANLIDFFRVSGFTNAASVVPERSGSAFALKPQSALAFELGQAPVRTIAHYEIAHRNVLADEPQLQGIINNELLYGLRLHEDYQILQGTGTGEDLTGILNTSGIQTQAQAASPDQGADTIRKAATKIMLAYYEPTGVVLHPNNWETIELIKDANDRYIVAGSVAVGAAKTLWRMPVVDTPAMPEDTGLVGAFGLGAQLYDRELATIRIAEQHSDFFVRNAITILAEERLALAVKRPESFCKVTGLT